MFADHVSKRDEVFLCHVFVFLCCSTFKPSPCPSSKTRSLFNFGVFIFGSLVGNHGLDAGDNRSGTVASDDPLATPVDQAMAAGDASLIFNSAKRRAPVQRVGDCVSDCHMFFLASSIASF